MNGLSGSQVTSHMSCDQSDGLLVWCERGGASCLVWISTRWLLMKSSGQDGGAALACCHFGDSRAKYEAKLMFYFMKVSHHALADINKMELCGVWSEVLCVSLLDVPVCTVTMTTESMFLLTLLTENTHTHTHVSMLQLAWR